MYVSIRTAFAMMKRKKAQTFLISIILLLVSTLLYIGLSMLDQTSSFEEMFTRANATESIYILSSEGNDIEKSKVFWENQNQVSGTSFQNIHMTNIEYGLNGKDEKEIVLIAEFQKDTDLDQLYINATEMATAPTGNQVLLNYNFAKTRNLEIGDLIDFTYEGRKHTLVIQNLIVDPHFSNPMSNDRGFVAPDFFENHRIEYDAVIMGVKYDSYSKEIERTLHEKYLKSIIDENPPGYALYANISDSYGAIAGIISGILIVISIIVLIIVIFIIRSIIGNMIVQQYKSIGVKKVLGYTNKQICNSYLWSYVCIALITSILGALIGLPIRNQINAGIGYDMQIGIDSGIDIYTFITVIIVLLLVYLFTYIVSKKASKIKPVQAIKYGMPESTLSTNTFRITGFKKLPLSILLAIKQLLINKKKSLSVIFIMMSFVYCALFINNLGSTLEDSTHFLKYLLGMRVGDFTVNISSDEPVEDIIKKVESIDNINGTIFVTYPLTESTKGLVGENIPIGGMKLYGDIPSDFITITKGRQPLNNQEIVINNTIAQEIGKTIGDYITIKSENIEQSFLISGTFNSQITYIRYESIVPESVSGENGFYWVYSHQKYDTIEEIETIIRSALSDPLSVSWYDSMMKNVLSTLEPFPVMIIGLLTIFTIISGVIMMNWTMMDINNMTRHIGILKATGFSNSNIVNILLIKSVLLSGVGILMGFILNLLTMNPIMLSVLKLTPFSHMELPAIFDFNGSLLLMGIFLCITIFATIIPSQKINKISPKKLMVE